MPILLQTSPWAVVRVGAHQHQIDHGHCCIRWPPALSTISVCDTPCPAISHAVSLRALVPGAGLVDIDVNRDTGLRGQIDRRRGGASNRRWPATGIAMGEDVHRFRRAFLRAAISRMMASPFPADGAVDLDCPRPPPPMPCGRAASARLALRAAETGRARIASSAQRRLIAVGPGPRGERHRRWTGRRRRHPRSSATPCHRRR